MAGKKQRRPIDFQTEEPAANGPVVLVRLADADNHARGVAVEAVALLESNVGSAAPVSWAAGHAPVYTAEESDLLAEIAAVPRWDRESRVLSVGGWIVKRYRLPSPNQEAVLSAFQQEGWPHRINDPLGFLADLDPKYRLYHTIGRLNQHQRQPLLRFYGDGTGEGVCWELCDVVSVSAAQAVDRLLGGRRAA